MEDIQFCQETVWAAKLVSLSVVGLVPPLARPGGERNGLPYGYRGRKRVTPGKPAKENVSDRILCGKRGNCFCGSPY